VALGILLRVRSLSRLPKKEILILLLIPETTRSMIASLFSTPTGENLNERTGNGMGH
jgi:hypothetical protein